MDAGEFDPISVDENYDGDSALGDDELSDTTSIASSIMKHRYEHGRRYHKFREGAYWGPNDDLQNEHLDIGHHMYKLVLEDRLLLAPVGSNVQAWSFPKDHFDLVHIRALFGSVADWPAFYKEAFEHTKPGGWINQLEMSIIPKSDDGSLTQDHLLSEWARLFIDAAEKFGKSFVVINDMKQRIMDAGFEDVTEVRYKVPLGMWPSNPALKEIGKWDLLYCYQGCEGWALFLLTNVMGWEAEDVKKLVARYKEALRDPKVHAYWEL
ncbi:putative methyltransferase tdiE [Lasiodiplodia theobromae]|uniref:Putative methyltransferase tdiE n=1 Tax=Lasiodiplodia theobromae TaxID=45133 RepID=A0A5N5CU08_9PEZI|nr:putative methyltransferase tdiE [Lasiodiplodia theobromae]